MKAVDVPNVTSCFNGTAAALFGSRKLDAALLRRHQQQPVNLQACRGIKVSQKTKRRIFRK